MSAAGTGAVLAGVLLLWLSWSVGRDRGSPRWRPAARAAGWLLLALSLWPWATAAGADRGVVLALLTVACVGLALVGGLGVRHRWQHPRGSHTRRRRSGSGARDKIRGEPRDRMTSRRRLLRRAWIIVLAGPASGLASALIAFSGYRAAAGWAPADRVALLMLAAPLIWAALAIVATYGISLARRNTIVGLGLTVGCVGAIMLRSTGS